MKKLFINIIFISVIFVFFAIALGKEVSFSKTIIALADVEPPKIEEIIEKWSEDIEITDEDIYNMNIGITPSSIEYLFKDIGLFFEKLSFSLGFLFELLIYPFELFNAFFRSLY